MESFLVKPELRPGSVQHFQPVQQTSGRAAVATKPFGFFWGMSMLNVLQRTIQNKNDTISETQTSIIKLCLAKDAEKKKVAMQ